MTGEFAGILRGLGAQFLQRDWLSANQIVFGAAGPQAPATVVDTGYSRHAEMTLALVERALAGQPLARIVNTHLHSDHCGGNRALQAHHPAETFVPVPSLDAARAWDEARLSYRATGQRCERFRVDGAIAPGSTIHLGAAEWQVHAAPGHDPEAVLLFEPQTRTLISGDALWEDRLAIIFPELFGQDGFGPTRRTLALIESLAPRIVIPGHGAVFGDATAALAASRRRLDAFEKDPARHAQHAARALVMFHMMEHRQRERAELERWLAATPIFALTARAGRSPLPPERWARTLVEGLVDDGLLQADGALVRLATANR
ncbi:MBL fold metallo-hydrolase [Ideonella sp.]|uniref:MBL fold metallo-hydrolase n=1 Tax=Ideonella sp. TaxID=1929293 RepID=UPI002B469D80|nr:MBL fold metallo-hydrolase [Ideonella sp.]HJV69817.1 MBL fold metallo-hydrolase [Ideonella sp.]